MSTRYFLDTNIIVYANDSRDSRKQNKAVDIISEAMVSNDGVISTQVLQEYSNVALKKLNQEYMDALGMPSACSASPENQWIT